MSAFESFAASRDEVVAARRTSVTSRPVVYDLRQSVQTVADSSAPSCVRPGSGIAG